MADTFGADKKNGEQAERLVAILHAAITKTPRLPFMFPNMEYIDGQIKKACEEGADLISFDGGSEEIKAIKNFLSRDNDDNEASGTLPFEIMNRDGNRQGWLYSILFPCLQKEKARTPSALIFVLLRDNLKGYATIAFEDVEELFSCLEKQAKEKLSWDIRDSAEWKIERLKEIAKDKSIIKGKTTAYCWHVPVADMISSDPTVTLIGDPPAMRTEIEKTRYEYLRSREGTRIITEENLKKIRRDIPSIQAAEAKKHEDKTGEKRDPSSIGVYLLDSRPFNQTASDDGQTTGNQEHK